MNKGPNFLADLRIFYSFSTQGLGFDYSYPEYSAQIPSSLHILKKA